jgi:acetoacetyl-CoA synthetase
MGDTPDIPRGEVLWWPPDDGQGSQLARYRDWLIDSGRAGVEVRHSYDALWHWSVTRLEDFWQSVWDYFGIRATTGPEVVLPERVMPGARWFPGARLNYADHVLRGISGPAARHVPPDRTGAVAQVADGPRVVARSQSRGPLELTHADLAEQVARCTAGLQRLGVRRGDRVAAYLPNIPEALVAMLAAASMGAVWSSCAPEFGVRSVVDRFRQIEPSVLLAIDGYRYGSKALSRVEEVAAIRDELPTVHSVITVPYLDPAARLDGTITWAELLSELRPPQPEPVPFDHPLYVLYSSGTTGLPKPIVHGHGGILLEHSKALGLHGDLGPGDRFFWFSTTGWMMWNYLVSGLLVGSTLVLFDGDPGHPDLGALWRMAGETGVSYFGTSAPFLMACRNAAVAPAGVADLPALRTVGSTGAPLPADGFRWVYEQLGEAVQLSSISGGTDVCTAFVGGSSLVPVRAGEISCRYLGAKVEAHDNAGRSLVGQEGELVITEPMPSMPVAFWGDDGSRLRAAYFEREPGVWSHGDWITIFEDGACVISGRSDATLNRAGVRMGTAELYSVIESLPEVADSLAVHLDDPGNALGKLVLFVTLAGTARLDDDLRGRIATALRSALSPRHVPDEIHEVPAVPRTLSGKKLEVPVKRILSGAAPDQAASRGSLANPNSLDAFVTYARPI